MPALTPRDDFEKWSDRSGFTISVDGLRFYNADLRAAYRAGRADALTPCPECGCVDIGCTQCSLIYSGDSPSKGKTE